MNSKTDKQIKKVIDDWAKAVRNCDMDGILTNHTSDMVMYDVIPFKTKGLRKRHFENKAIFCSKKQSKIIMDYCYSKIKETMAISFSKHYRIFDNRMDYKLLN